MLLVHSPPQLSPLVDHRLPSVTVNSKINPYAVQETVLNFLDKYCNIEMKVALDLFEKKTL